MRFSVTVMKNLTLISKSNSFQSVYPDIHFHICIVNMDADMNSILRYLSAERQ